MLVDYSWSTDQHNQLGDSLRDGLLLWHYAVCDNCARSLACSIFIPWASGHERKVLRSLWISDPFASYRCFSSIHWELQEPQTSFPFIGFFNLAYKIAIIPVLEDRERWKRREIRRPQTNLYFLDRSMDLPSCMGYSNSSTCYPYERKGGSYLGIRG